MDKIKIIIIGGPTASGKSELAVQAALALEGEVISCDSMQIYKGMDIGTAKIRADEMRGVPHHMLDVADPKQPFSAFDYSHAVTKIINELRCKGKMPIIVGGTGLYVESLVYPLSFIAQSDESVRKRLYREYESLGAQTMYERLCEIDPQDAAKIHPNNVKRLLRALEIYEISGKTKSQCAEREINPAYEIGMFITDPQRELLYAAIDARVEKMFEQGIVGEVETLLSNGVSWDSQSMQAIGYKEFKPYFAGKATLEEVKADIKRNSKKYAKRQTTWFKRYSFAKHYKNDEYGKMLADMVEFGKNE